MSGPGPGSGLVPGPAPGTSAGRRAELLAPAGGPPALQAALSAGADAVYLGLDSWSARAFAANFDAEALLAAIDRAHLFGAAVHLALNVQLKDEELEPALEALAAPYAAGLDALIVADLGFAALVREAYPQLELHASTQLDTHSSAQFERLAALGFERAILARELSLAEIAALEPHGLALEAFVHGALCYGYSGACLLSSMASGRSGNRGRCSQACRMRYRLEGGAGAPNQAGRPLRAGGAGTLDATGEPRRRPKRADGEPRSRPGRADDEPRRLLSTADLAALGALPALLEAGVTSFKIEGRMKDAAYVAVTTTVYREALDAALDDPERFAVEPAWLARLEQSFSRSFTTAHLAGDHAAVRAAGRGGHRGVQIGRVEAVDEARGRVTVRVDGQLHEADIVQIYTTWGATQPASLAALLADGSTDASLLQSGRLVLRLSERVSVKDRVFRTSSGHSDELAADAVTGRTLVRPFWLSAALSGHHGERPRLLVEAAGVEVTIEGESPLEEARTAGLTADKARRAIGALGGTPYVLGEFSFAIDEGAFLGVGALKELRRRAVAELDARRLAERRRAQPAAAPPAPRPARRSAPSGATSATRPAPAAGLPSETRSAPALRSAAGAGGRPSVVLRLRPGEELTGVAHADAVCLDLRAGDHLALIAAARTAARAAGLPVRVRSPEVLFDADREWSVAIAALEWEVVYARHLGALDWAGTVYLEYPLQGLHAGTAAVLGADGVLSAPEQTLGDLARLTAAAGGAARGGAGGAARGGGGPAAAGPPPPLAVETLVFGREQVLVSRDTLGLAEGLAAAPTPDRGPARAPAPAQSPAAAALTLTDTRGYAFPVLVAAGETRIFNARVTNLCGHLAELATAGVGGVVVVPSDMNAAERRAFDRDGLAGLAAFDDRERFTTGHLFRGVA